ncbi:MAG: GNAT family N-acetyltransferase [Bacillota bacterium]|nr:GNAT family N-acetyltransferase [Bacillota bacterium]
MEIRIITNVKFAKIIADIHMKTFPGFFLTFLGKGFLTLLYKGFIKHDRSNVIGAFENDKLVGFLAYSENISQFYKYLVKKSLLLFAWYSFLAVFRKPGVMFRLMRALTYSINCEQDDPFIELSSIGVLPEAKNKGVGGKLIDALKNTVDRMSFKYIKLETDKINNDNVNAFYLKNGFKLNKSYTTREGRLMNEYRYEFVGNPLESIGG